MSKYEDLSGKRFGKLLVKGSAGIKVNKQPGWLCTCDCGGSKIVVRYHLTNGSVTSCGCNAKYTTPRFIEEAVKVHGNLYDYSKVKYKGSQSFVTITCPLHDSFEQRAAIHLSGSGCQQCASIRMGKAHAISAQEFDTEAQKVRSDAEYNLAEYNISTEAIPFICKVHHKMYMQKPAAYLAGNQGCKDCCGKMRDKSTFIQKAEEVHGKGAYDYSLVEYKKSKSKVVIICAEGHVFQQTPHNHTAGRHGCPSCGPCGFDIGKDSWLYVLSASDITKIGITNRSASIRAKNVSKASGKTFIVMAEYKLEGQFCSDLETKLLRYYRTIFNKPVDAFEGSSECFIGLSADRAKADIEKHLEKYDKTQIWTGFENTPNLFELQE